MLNLEKRLIGGTVEIYDNSSGPLEEGYILEFLEDGLLILESQIEPEKETEVIRILKYEEVYLYADKHCIRDFMETKRGDNCERHVIKFLNRGVLTTFADDFEVFDYDKVIIDCSKMNRPVGMLKSGSKFKLPEDFNVCIKD